MRTIYRDNYTPQLGDYHDRLIIDGAQDKKWLFDCDGVYTEMDGAEVVNEKGDSTTKAISQKLFTDETNSLAQDITDEANTRSDADRAIWQEIEDIEAASDVTDVVGTHADLEAYDTSKLKDNDIIKVLEDETQDDQITYYRWDIDTETFTLIGAVGPYYTKTEADTTFQGKLTAGANVAIDADNVISATDTTYSNFVGTDGVDPGVAGLVPAPATTDAGKYLQADGTWATVSAGPTVVQTTGASQTDVMSQAATSQMIFPSGYETTRHRIAIGDGTTTLATGEDSIAIGSKLTGNTNNTIAVSGGIAIGHSARAYTTNALAIGNDLQATATGATAIGPFSWATAPNSFAVNGGQATNQYAIAMLPSSQASASGSIAIGYSSKAQNAGAIAIGDTATTNNAESIVIGHGAAAASSSYGSIAIGEHSANSAQTTITLGGYARATANYGIAIGSVMSSNTQYGAESNHIGSIALGYRAKTGRNYELSLGTTGSLTRYIANVKDPDLAQDAATKNYVDTLALGTTESYTIADTDWVALTGVEPYTYGAVVTAAYTIGANTICELFNDDAVLFANHGFAIGAVNSQTVAIYAVTAPTSSVTLRINYKG